MMLSKQAPLTAWPPPGASADEPARGKLLVATENVGGPAFAKTVILLLHYRASTLARKRPVALAGSR